MRKLCFSLVLLIPVVFSNSTIAKAEANSSVITLEAMIQTLLQSNTQVNQSFLDSLIDETLPGQCTVDSPLAN